MYLGDVDWVGLMDMEHALSILFHKLGFTWQAVLLSTLLLTKGGLGRVAILRGQKPLNHERELDQANPKTWLYKCDKDKQP